MTSQKWSLIASLVLLTIGGFILFGPLVHILHINLIRDTYRGGAGIIAPLLGLVFVYLGITITRGFRMTLYITSSVLCLGLLFCLFNLLHHPTISIVSLMLLIGVAAIALIPLYAKPPVRSRISANWYSFLALIIVGSAGLLYGTIGFMAFGPHLFHQTNTPFLGGLAETIETMVLPDELIAAPTHGAQLFIASLDAIGFIEVFLILGVFIQPMKLHRASTIRDRRQLESLLRNYPAAADDYFKLWPQPKRYFFSTSRQSCITFLPARRSLFVLGDPNGDPAEFSTLIQAFVAYCREHGWLLCVIMPSDAISRRYKMAAKELHSVALGNEATVLVATFAESTIRDKHFRYVTNKARREGLTVEELDTLDTATLRRLKHISDEWLRRGRHEYTFFMGQFSPEYLRASRVFVLKQGDTWLAYTSLLPTYQADLASIDHFRFVEKMPSTGMHFLLSEVLLCLHKEAVATFNLGLAPLAHIGRGKDAPQQRLLGIAKRLGNRYYSFDGVAQFKGKFDPTWKKASVLYEGSALSIPGIIGEFESISSYNRRLSRSIPIVSAAAIIATVTTVIYIAAQ
ncbi:MAG TPA: phosphatidylglycerol lysyltransferase domain-containing protein [Dongiaceae bacterium]|nr:phosphatidylglycerol lysyltransferase domain-containing protein [Dongiaceae bacterium]